MSEPTLEQRLDDAIARTQALIEANAEILAMHQCLDELRSGTRQPTVRLGAAELEAIDDEQIGQEIARCPWKW